MRKHIIYLEKKDENGNNIGGYLDPEKRNIKALKLRGEKPVTQIALIGTLGAISLYLVSRAIFWLTESWKNIRKKRCK